MSTAVALSGAVALLCLVGPPALLSVLVRAYPHGHPRRDELVAELGEIPYRHRVVWVARLAPTCLTEGLRARRGGHDRLVAIMRSTSICGVVGAILGLLYPGASRGAYITGGFNDLPPMGSGSADCAALASVPAGATPHAIAFGAALGVATALGGAALGAAVRPLARRAHRHARRRVSGPRLDPPTDTHH